MSLGKEVRASLSRSRGATDLGWDILAQVAGGLFGWCVVSQVGAVFETNWRTGIGGLFLRISGGIFETFRAARRLSK